MMKGLSLAIILMGFVTISACSQKVAGTKHFQGTWSEISPQRHVGVSVRPSHLIYRMTGDYADLVPVNTDNMGNILSYPDPVDITDSQKPVALGDGWYLDRRGINGNTAFLDYTYDEYHKLPKVPDQATLKAHVKVKFAIGTIWSCGTEERTIAEYKELVKKGFPGCKCVSQGMPVITK